MSLLKLLLFSGLGMVFAYAANLHGLEQQNWYSLATALLLAIGLYGSTYGIVLADARTHLRIILSAVTVGVLVKALLIGGSLTLIFGNPFWFLLGIAVAQIDPLSVASLMNNPRMSSKAKTILASWASFDDPITVILTLYTPAALLLWFGIDLQPRVAQEADIASIVINFALNGIFAAGTFLIWKILVQYHGAASALKGTILIAASYILLALAFTIAISFFLMLGLALIGLFLRPNITRYIDKTISMALCAAAFLLGILLYNGFNLRLGLSLGLAAYTAQCIVGWLLTRGLTARDRWHIALAQQNGITAIILSLLLEIAYPGTVAIVGPAVITINVLHYAVNKLADWLLHEEPIEV